VNLVLDSSAAARVARVRVLLFPIEFQLHCRFVLHHDFPLADKSSVASVAGSIVRAARFFLSQPNFCATEFSSPFTYFGSPLPILVFPLRLHISVLLYLFRFSRSVYIFRFSFTYFSFPAPFTYFGSPLPISVFPLHLHISVLLYLFRFSRSIYIFRFSFTYFGFPVPRPAGPHFQVPASEELSVLLALQSEIWGSFSFCLPHAYTAHSIRPVVLVLGFVFPLLRSRCASPGSGSDRLFRSQLWVL
jgi:hypothetical protein